MTDSIQNIIVSFENIKRDNRDLLLIRLIKPSLPFDNSLVRTICLPANIAAEACSQPFLFVDHVLNAINTGMQELLSTKEIMND